LFTILKALGGLVEHLVHSGDHLVSLERLLLGALQLMIEELIELVCDAVHHVLPRLYHPVLCAHLSENGVHELAPADVSFLFCLTI
jgi:hypothetical protein